MTKDYTYIEFPAMRKNESFARMVAAAFASSLDPTMDELADIKTAVSEAVTNCVIHAYPNGEEGIVSMELSIENKDTLRVVIFDRGVGIPNITEAMQPLYTSRPDLERSGMGFSFMEAYMDYLEVASEVGKGTRVTMTKTIKHDLAFW